MAYTTVNKSSDYFNTKLYTGTGSSNAITGVGFQPDLLWIKSRSNTYSHSWTDAVRGKDNKIASNNSNAQYTDSGQLASFDSDGFTLNTDAGVNNNGSTFTSWNWKANGAGSSNTNGSITSTVSANTTSGFSIVKWTGTSANATIGHGLGAVPKMIIIKSLANATFWMTYHSSLGNNSEIYLNRADYGASASSTAWQDTDPTSSVFYVGGGGGDGVNVSGDYVAYCFAEKKGYSKINSYVGNGGNNNEAPFIYTGFKPSFFLVKKSSASGEDWAIYDDKRNAFNKVDEALFPSATTVETSVGNGIDFLSNGIKINDDGGELNTSGATYIYYAIGQSIVGTNNVPATAR
tara:strand:- start:1022 stop:2065 length:1044 start_codon:yes stop_codon:yes gene_type:complete